MFSFALINVPHYFCVIRYRAHFGKMQEMTGKCQAKAIYLYRIAGHRKIKVNHVGGLTETTKHHEIDAESGMT